MALMLPLKEYIQKQISKVAQILHGELRQIESMPCAPSSRITDEGDIASVSENLKNRLNEICL